MAREHVISIDPAKALAEEPKTGHNRWPESIEPLLEADPGDTVIYETRDAFDGQFHPGSSAEDVSAANLNVVHPLTGPVYVKGAEPGDLLEVRLLAIEPDPWDQWGYTIEVPGFGFLRDELPGVRLRCNPMLGTFGLAPSRQLRERIIERERELTDRGAFALPPEPED